MVRGSESVACRVLENLFHFGSLFLLSPQTAMMGCHSTEFVFSIIVVMTLALPAALGRPSDEGPLLYGLARKFGR